MNIVKAHNLACPIDGLKLEASDKQLVCENGHSFDIARQGYVNLLPVQHKRSKQPGDSKEMVAARTELLNSSIYKPIANKLADIASTLISNDNETCLLDAGCGEGYYLGRVFNALQDKDGNNELSFVGLDISRDAIIAATKRNKEISWVVGTNRQPPVVSESVDIILCVFGFQSFDGFKKILKSGGKIILIEPGSEHLKELREVIYDDVRKSEPKDLFHLEETGYSLIDEQLLQFKTGAIDNSLIKHLLLMTPHFHRVKQEGKEAAANLQTLNLTVDVVFRVLARTGCID